MKLKYGSKSYEIKTGEEAADMWEIIRNEAMAKGFGPDDMKSIPIIMDDSGKTLGWVSWNASVWRGKPGSIKKDWVDEVLPMMAV